MTLPKISKVASSPSGVVRSPAMIAGTDSEA
jgi:hypothetical protein